MKKSLALTAALTLLLSLSACSNGNLPRDVRQQSAINSAVTEFVDAMAADSMELHSVMVVQRGKVTAQRWLGDNTPDKPHVMWSVSKTFLSAAVGIAIGEGKLHLDDKVVEFFPDRIRPDVEGDFQAMTLRDLLTMSSGHNEEPSKEGDDLIANFFSTPLAHKPGEWFSYNSVGSYLISAMLQQATGETVLDYLRTRLFAPLKISDASWDESPQGINWGGWGLSLRTEDMAKMGQLMLQKGKWRRKQIIPEEWMNEATKFQIANYWPGTETGDNDWWQGYGYHIWRCTHNAFRADGSRGQYIIVIPEKQCVIVTTSNVREMEDELTLIWKHIYPAL